MTLTAIPLLPSAEIARLRVAVATRAAELRRSLTWLDTVDVVQADTGDRPARLRVAAFNLERGSRFDGIARLLTTHPVLRDGDVFLLSAGDCPHPNFTSRNPFAPSRTRLLRVRIEGRAAVVTPSLDTRLRKRRYSGRTAGARCTIFAPHDEPRT